MNDICPRCQGTEFDELDCGPDTYEDDITYQSLKCRSCGLWYDGWSNDWFIDVECNFDVETADIYPTEEQV